MAPRSASAEAADRVSFTPVDGAASLLTQPFLDYLVGMPEEFAPRAHALRATREQVLRRALAEGELPAPLPPSPATSGTWRVPTVPADLLRPGIEISGPCS